MIYNKGVSKARNFGITQSTGDFICFLDADDTLERNALKNVNKLISQNPCDLVITKYDLKIINYSNEFNKIDDLQEYYQICMANPTKMANIHGIFINREFLINHNLKFNEALSHAEDTVFFSDLLLTEPLIYDYDIGVYHYVYRNDSVTRTVNDKFSDPFIDAIKVLYQSTKAQSKSIVNGTYLMALNNLLIIYVHDIFLRKEMINSIKKAKQISEIDVFKTAKENCDIKYTGKMKKLLFYAIKRNHFLIVFIACKIRIFNNMRKEHSSK